MIPDFSALRYFFWAFLIALPFGIWKIVELIIWAVSHVSVSIH